MNTIIDFKINPELSQSDLPASIKGGNIILMQHQKTDAFTIASRFHSLARSLHPRPETIDLVDKTYARMLLDEDHILIDAAKRSRDKDLRVAAIDARKNDGVYIANPAVHPTINALERAGVRMVHVLENLQEFKKVGFADATTTPELSGADIILFTDGDMNLQDQVDSELGNLPSYKNKQVRMSSHADNEEIVQREGLTGVAMLIHAGPPVASGICSFLPAAEARHGGHCAHAQKRREGVKHEHKRGRVLLRQWLPRGTREQQGPMRGPARGNNVEHHEHCRIQRRKWG